MDNTSPSFTFFDGLQLLFIGLKLAGVINWSWWTVMSPLLAAFCIGLIQTIVAYAAIKKFG